MALPPRRASSRSVK